MSPNRIFFLKLAVFYVVFAGAGLALFQGPNYSSEYLAEHGKDHEKYLKISEELPYQLFSERPHLNPLPPEMEEEGLWAKEYAESHAFLAQHHRIMAYTLWFRLLNAFAVFAIAFHFVKTPLLQFLDGQINVIRGEFDATEQELAEAQKQCDGAAGTLAGWPEKEKEILVRTEKALENGLAKVDEETNFAREQIAREIVNRKEGELIAAAQSLKLELVNTAMQELEAKYMQDTSGERLSDSVDEFVRFMGCLA